MDRLIEMRERGLSISAIAREIECDRKTVRKWLSEGRYRPKKLGPQRSSKLDPHKEYIMRRLGEGVFNTSVLLRELRAQGYLGGRSILKDFVSPFRQQRQVQATVRFETPPGEQVQMDWGECGELEEGGVSRKVYCFSLVLGYSRMLYAEFVTQRDVDAMIGCVLRGFKYFGGLPKVILTDNMSQVTPGRDADKRPRWNQRFLDFTRHYGLTVRLCRFRRPATKGKIESGVGYVKGNFLPGVREVFSLADLNAQLRTWLAETANCRVHGTTHELPIRRLPDEHLRPLTGVPEFDTARHLRRRVSRDCYVDVETNRYSVPWIHAGRDVTVRITSEGLLEVLWDGTSIARHQVVPGRYQLVTDPRHFEGLPLGETQPANRFRLPVAAPAVEVRPLSAYEALAEVGDR